MEVDPRLLVARCFVALDHPPTEEEIPRFLVEYHRAFLVFLYQSSEGTWWAQFDIPRNCLPRYAFARDLLSPAPPDDTYQDWRCRAKLLESKALQFFCENLRKTAHRAFALAGAGAGDSASKRLDQSQQQLIPVSPGNTIDWKERMFNEFWAEAVWRKIGKGTCRKSWNKAAKNESIARQIITAAKEQGKIQKQLAQIRGHSELWPQTWLNQGRWEDDPEDLKALLDDAKKATRAKGGLIFDDDDDYLPVR